MGLALAYARTGSFDAARDRFATVVEIADELDDASLRIASLNNLAYVEYWAGEPEASMRVAREMQRVSEAHGLVLDASFLDTVARAQMLMGDYEAAERTLAPVLAEDGEGLARESDSLAEVLLTLAECQRMIGATDRASASLARSAELCEQRNLEEVRVRVMEEQAKVLAARGDFRAAYEQHREFHAASQAIFSSERDARARILATVFETEEAVRSSKRFREMSLRDPLTGLYNRRYVDDRVPSLLSRSRTHATYLSVAILDLDHFKAVNDQLSHDTGDEVLRRLAPLLQSGAAEDGFAARLGGEEFLVVLPGFDAEQAARRCETLRRVVREHAWRDARRRPAGHGEHRRRDDVRRRAAVHRAARRGRPLPLRGQARRPRPRRHRLTSPRPLPANSQEFVAWDRSRRANSWEFAGSGRGQASRRMVTGPSLTSSTSMCAPKRPVLTSSPRACSAATTSATIGSATGPGAAADHDGRRPLRVSA